MPGGRKGVGEQVREGGWRYEEWEHCRSEEMMCMVLGCTRAVVQLICRVPCLCVSGCNAASVTSMIEKMYHSLLSMEIAP